MVSNVTTSEFRSLRFDETLSFYKKQWESFSGKDYLKKLKSLAIKGTLKTSHFRSICWKVFLGCLPENRDLWVDTAKLQRQQYIELLEKFDSNPRDASCLDINVNNPLSQAQQNPWNQYFKDNELKITIQQDVVRTFPEIEFFHTPDIQKMMESILFSYAREYPHISYKQGMHELLAPIIFVLHYDQQAYLHASETESLDMDIHILLNQNYIEHDAYFIFCHLMEIVESWYTVNDILSSEYVTRITPEPFSQSSTFSGNSLTTKLKKIYEYLLKRHDVELFSYLEQMEITPQIFGIRWLRLLFGREFSINDLLILWDAIFSDSITFELVDYIFVAMLISVRELLLNGDYASCLNHLMRFPNVVDVHYIIDLALHLRNPDRYKKPEGNSMKIPNPLHLKAFKDVKLNVNKDTSKGLYPGTAKPVNKIHDNIIKYSECRPKSLSIAAVNMVCNNSTEPSLSSSRPKSSSLNEGSSSPDLYDSNGLDYSSFVYVGFVPPVDGSCSSSSTLPRKKICNVMEGKNQFGASDLSKNLGYISDKKLSSKTVDTEMIPLALPSTSTLTLSYPEHSVKSYISSSQSVYEEVKKLKSQLSQLKLMNKYCTQQITQDIEKLQESLMHQCLQNEDQMFIALAGLKRTRDILKGTISFSEEIMGDDVDSYCIVSHDTTSHSSNSSPDAHVKPKCMQHQPIASCQEVNNEDEYTRWILNECDMEKRNYDKCNCCSSDPFPKASNLSAEQQAEILSTFQEKLNLNSQSSS